jgi:hypothetical protein
MESCSSVIVLHLYSHKQVYFLYTGVTEPERRRSGHSLFQDIIQSLPGVTERNH